jgi:hypothetical protein
MPPEAKAGSPGFLDGTDPREEIEIRKMRLEYGMKNR